MAAVPDDADMLAQHVAALNRHDPRAVLALYGEQCQWAEPPGGADYEGKRRLAQYLVLLFHAFPDLRVSVLRSLSSGGVVAAEWRAEATHRGAFLGIRGTGLPITVHGASFLDVRDGQVERSQHYCDSATVLRQLGLSPAGEPL